MSLNKFVGLTLLTILAALPLFLHLDELPLQLWDEACLAIKAYEMSKGGSWLITTVYGFPDMVSVKPPLLTWVQAISIKILGANELAIRLPSALAALGTVFLIYWFFAWKYIKDAWLGIAICISLVTAQGFVTLHGARSGDYDATLTFFTTGFLLFFFLFIEENRPKHLHAAFLFILFAALTKGIQPLIFLPAILLYALLRQKVLAFLNKWLFYLDTVLVMGIVIGYYLLCEKYNPGYISSVMRNEVSGRFGSVIENHGEPFYYYFGWIAQNAFNFHYAPALVGAIIAVRSQRKEFKNLGQFAAISGVVYLTVISSSQTKCWWYVMPVLPILAICSGIFYYSVISLVMNQLLGIKSKYALAQTVVFMAIFFMPYVKVVQYAANKPPAES